MSSKTFWNKCKMRKRFELPLAGETSTDDISLDGSSLNGSLKTKTSIHSVPFYVGIAIVTFLFALYGAVFLIDDILPNPLDLNDEKSNPDAFITERVRKDLKSLTDFGPRIVGSYENEILGAEFLEMQLHEIVVEAHNNQEIELDVQVVSGSHFLDNHILAYANLQNVIVKLHGRNNSKNSLLINAHFDSVPTSPGGSDDGINCAVMMEVLRKLSKKSTRPLNNVIFLFNGAEETGLQAAHGFITKHRWAKESKVVVNLEATGSGGKIILFQTGPEASWLMDYYNEVSHPYGQVAGEEIFQSGILPSDTDFRIFRDYGGLVGVDMAFFKNGYRYHTKYDDYSHIPHGTFQHVGDNTLDLVSGLADAPELANPKTEDDKIVYYDIFGLFMISYTRYIGSVINYVTVAVSFALFFLSVHNFKLGYTKQTLAYVGITFGAVIGGWILAAGFVALLALLLDGVGYPMSWYGNPWILLGLYVTPTFALSCCLIPFIRHQKLTLNVKAQIQAHAVRLIWTLILFIGTILNIRSMYAVLVPVFFNTATFLLIYIFRMQHTRRVWQIFYLVVNIVPTIFLMYIALTTLALFVPISGRMGSDQNVELLIGMMTVLFTILITCPIVAFVSLLRDFWYFLGILGAGFLIFFIIVFTPLGFPYRADPNHPAAERQLIIHTSRVVHGEDGHVIKKDAGYSLFNMDRNSPGKIRDHVDELSNEKSLEGDCDKYLMCGLPLSDSNIENIVGRSTWIPAVPPVFPEPTTLEVVSKEILSPSLLRYTISIAGPDRTGVYISPKPNMEIVAISLVDELPIDDIKYFNSRPVYFIEYLYGKDETPLRFSFDVKVPMNATNGLTTEIAVSGTYVHDKTNEKVPEYVKFLKQFPDWAHLNPWLGSFESWWI